jgi:hypothetical protein
MAGGVDVGAGVGAERDTPGLLPLVAEACELRDFYVRVAGVRDHALLDGHGEVDDAGHRCTLILVFNGTGCCAMIFVFG